MLSGCLAGGEPMPRDSGDAHEQGDDKQGGKRRELSHGWLLERSIGVPESRPPSPTDTSAPRAQWRVLGCAPVNAGSPPDDRRIGAIRTNCGRHKDNAAHLRNSACVIL